MHVAIPDDPVRRSEWRLWAEMWAYAGRDPEFAAQLVETDARWEREIRAVLGRAGEEGVLPGIDADREAPLLARLIDGLGLRAWLSGRWSEARAQLVIHLAELGCGSAAAAAHVRGGEPMNGKRTVIAGGTLATDYGVFAADIVIEDGRVAAIVEQADRASADELIDAAGLVLLPGAIDMHSHFEDPGHTEREDFTTGTMSAAAGGITTVLEHPLTYPPVTTVQLYREKREMARRKVVVDFGLWGALTPPSIPEIGASGRRARAPSRRSCRSRIPHIRTSATPSSWTACAR